MTDKQIIRTEIERRRKELPPPDLKTTVGADSIRMNKLYEELLSFIDSMPEDLVSEGLEEAAISLGDKMNRYTTYGDLGRLSFRYSYAFKAGANWQKQQIMKEANTYVVERHYDKRIGKYLSPDITLNEQMFKIGDKVKLIIIK